MPSAMWVRLPVARGSAWSTCVSLHATLVSMTWPGSQTASPQPTLTWCPCKKCAFLCPHCPCHACHDPGLTYSQASRLRKGSGSIPTFSCNASRTPLQQRLSWALASADMAAGVDPPPDDAWYMAVRRCMEAVSQSSGRLGLQFLGSMAPRPAPSGEAEQGGFHAVAGHAGLLHGHILSHLRENRRRGAPLGGVRRPRPGSVPSALPAAATASTAGEAAAWTAAELPEPERMAALAKHAVQIAQGVEDSMMPEVSMVLHPFAAAGPVAFVSGMAGGPRHASVTASYTSSTPDTDVEQLRYTTPRPDSTGIE